MSLYDYRASQEIDAQGHSFRALIMAAMRKADTDNLAKLHAAFPDVWNELWARYGAPGAQLPGEVRETVRLMTDEPPREA